MIYRCTDLGGTSTIQADICIIGCEPAAVALALRLSNAQVSVCVIDEGQLSPSSFESCGNEPFPPILAKAVHALSSATGQWVKLHRGNFNALAGEIVNDFENYEKRADEVAGVYSAPPLLDLAGMEYSSTEHWKELSCYSKFAKVRNWGALLIGAARSNPLLDLFVGFRAGTIEVMHGRATKIVAASTVVRGRRTPINAQFFVLGAGAVATARILLSSGIGRSHDQVGRYYGVTKFGKIGFLERYAPMYPKTKDGMRYSQLSNCITYGLSSEMMEHGQIPDHKLLFVPMVEESIFWRRMRKVLNLDYSLAYTAVAYIEDIPSCENRVILDGGVDKDGLPNVSVQYRDCVTSMDKLVCCVRAFFQLHSIGELQTRIGEGLPLNKIGQFQPWIPAFGTARMGDDPNSSVVDSSCRVHLVENLYVIGQSVFRRTFASDPTAIGVILSLRVADILKNSI